MRKKLEKIKGYAIKVPSKAKEMQKEVRRKSSTAILGAFALIIALVWRDVIRDAVDEIVRRTGIEGTGYMYTIISALLVTVICVTGIMFFSRWAEKK